MRMWDASPGSTASALHTFKLYIMIMCALVANFFSLCARARAIVSRRAAAAAHVPSPPPQSFIIILYAYYYYYYYIIIIIICIAVVGAQTM